MSRTIKDSRLLSDVERLMAHVARQRPMGMLKHLQTSAERERRAEELRGERIPVYASRGR